MGIFGNLFKTNKNNNTGVSEKVTVPDEKSIPVQIIGNGIYIDSKHLFARKKEHPETPRYELDAVLLLSEKTPTISLYEDGIKKRDYCLQTPEGEDFTGKYFHIGVRLGFAGDPPVPIAQIDGFVSDNFEDRQMGSDNIGYRMEVYILSCGGEAGARRFEMNRGQDLPMKALKYPGYTTPSNVRLIGICHECGKSFAFHGRACYLGDYDVAYSDDGLDCLAIPGRIENKETWNYKTNGKTFRYYNSFCCPHCGAPYIDYKKYQENKVFGVSGCVHLGRDLLYAEQ